MQLYETAFFLVGSHLLCDYVLQTDTVAREKSRYSATELQKHVPWYHWLTAHAFIQGMGVAIVTGSVKLGIAETIAHWLIDFGKCEKKFSFAVDQLMHLACKAIWLYCWWHQ